MDNKITDMIINELDKNADKKTKETAYRFFKEHIKVRGVKSAAVSKIAKKHFMSIKHLPKEEVFSLCEALLKTDYSEDSFVAFAWAYRLHKQYEEKDLLVFEKWIERYVNNWAKCDTLCNHTVGEFVMMFPRYVEKLKVWAKSKNRWVKRASAVTLIIPAKRGKFLKDIFEIADILLLDDDDLVQKGYGWMLKAASQAHEKEVFDYVMKNKKKMPRTALRYAIEKMPKDLKIKAMEK